MDSHKWDAYLSICRKVETSGAGDDVSRDPRDLAMQREFVDVFRGFLPSGGRVLAPGAVTEALMLADFYTVHAIVLGVDNVRWLNEGRKALRRPDQLIVRELDAHDLDYPEGFFDGYFTIQVHEHWIAPYVHIGEVRYAMRDGGIVFVDAAGTTNSAMRQIWHTNLVPEQQVKEQWEYWGFDEKWRGPEGDNRPRFVFEKLGMNDGRFTNAGYLRHVMDARRELERR